MNASKPRDHRPSVLIVDDNARLLRGLTRLLGEQFDVATAVSAAEATAMLADHPFDVVLADHQMPGTPGVQLLVKVKQDYPKVVPILMSGEITPSVRKVAQNEIGVCRLIEKPFRNAQIVEAIDAALAKQQQLQNEPSEEELTFGSL